MSKDGAAEVVPAESATTKAGLGEPLFDPKEKAKVDIVFVHGLGGDRIATWTWKDRDSPRTQFWPQTLLPKDCPTARILSFGYNADFAHFYPKDLKTIAPELTIDNYSTSLFQALIVLRGKTKTPADRPIIFVAHSLGGLVVANALSRSYGTDEAAKEIADHTIGTLFLGTPFKGSDVAEYGNLALRLLNYLIPTQGANMADLKNGSTKLASISDLFAKFLKERDRSDTLPWLEVACFFEELPLYSRVTALPIGLIVPKESANWLGIDGISIPKNHIEMCKFETELGSDYKSVAGKLSQWIENINKPREGSKRNVGGLIAEKIGVYQGPTNNQGINNYGGVVTGANYSTASDGIRTTGTSNTYYYSSPPPGPNPNPSPNPLAPNPWKGGV